MLFIKAGYAFLLLLLLTAGLFGCARKKPYANLSIYNDQYVVSSKPAAALPSQPNRPAAKNIMSPFQELVFSLFSDSLDLLPKQISDSYYEVILKGIELPDQDDEIADTLLSSQRKEDIAFVAALIVQRVYGKSAEKGTLIPQSVVYSFKDRVVYADLIDAAAKLESSQNRGLDAYNYCLNLLVNTLYGNSSSMSTKPHNGLYVRDVYNNLYFHQKM